MDILNYPELAANAFNLYCFSQTAFIILFGLQAIMWWKKDWSNNWPIIILICVSMQVAIWELLFRFGD